MKNNFRARLIIATVFSLLAMASFVWLRGEINETEAISDAKINTWRTEEARRDDIRSLRSLIQNIEDERVEVESHFVPISNPVPFLDTLENLATKVGAKNSILAVELSKDGKTLSVNMNAVGSFASVYKFLKLLENSPYDLEITALTMSKSGEAVGSDWSLVIKAKVLTFVK